MNKFIFTLFYSGLFLISPYSLESKLKKQPYVTCQLVGQLGNQLFQIATTLAYGWEHHLNPIFPELVKKDYRQDINRERIFFRLNDMPLPRPIKRIVKDPINFESLPYSPDCYLQGFFQSWKYFNKYRNKILETFAPSENDYHYLLVKYGGLIENPNTVAVHVRTQDPVAHSAFPFLGIEYYKKGMDIFPDETQFVIFSDRIEWCKIHFKDFDDKKIVFIEGNDYIQDLHLMSLMKNHIIANSTFSWWGAYLCQNPNKITIAPTPWTHPNFSQYVPKKEDLYLPDWYLLDYDYSLPFPGDIALYISESIDNN